jgi:hypothetical protein
MLHFTRLLQGPCPAPIGCIVDSSLLGLLCHCCCKFFEFSALPPAYCGAGQLRTLDALASTRFEMKCGSVFLTALPGACAGVCATLCVDICRCASAALLRNNVWGCRRSFVCPHHLYTSAPPLLPLLHPQPAANTATLLTKSPLLLLTRRLLLLLLRSGPCCWPHVPPVRIHVSAHRTQDRAGGSPA